MWQPNKYKIAIGIDAGTKTGYAVWNKRDKRFEEISTLMIHRAMEKIKRMHTDGYEMVVIVEDARQATFGRQNDIAKAQGAGSVKRDAKIWEDFLRDYNIPYLMKRPNKALTKMDKILFNRTTQYTGLTSSHGRDAAMLVYGM